MGEHPDRPPDRPREACGVVGIHAPGEEASNLAYYGLFALQHRGQESAGIAVSEGATIVVYKDMGLVSQVFDNEKLSSLPGHIAIGHVRYSTTGSSLWENAQPTYKTAGNLEIALGHNGNLINTRELAELAGEPSGSLRADAPPGPTHTPSPLAASRQENRQ